MMRNGTSFRGKQQKEGAEASEEAKQQNICSAGFLPSRTGAFLGKENTPEHQQSSLLSDKPRSNPSRAGAD